MNKIVILHNAPAGNAGPDDMDTLAQVEAIESACLRSGYLTERAPLDETLLPTMKALTISHPDLVFNLVEHVGGSDFNAAKIPMMLGAYGLKYTGSHSSAVRAAGDKLRTKIRLVECGLPTPPWHPYGHGGFCPGQWIIKSVREHASKGMDADSVIYAETVEELERKTAEAGKSGNDWFAELFIDGREFNISVLDSGSDAVVLPPAEIRFLDFEGRPRIVDYEAKWVPESHGYSHTPRSFEFPETDAVLLTQLKEYAVECRSAFGLTGYCRVDFRVDEQNRPYIIDINANPCLSPDAGFAAAADRHGMSYEKLISTIVENAF